MQEDFVTGVYRERAGVKKKLIEKYKTNLLVQAITMTTIVTVVCIINFLDIAQIKNLGTSKILVAEYKENHKYGEIKAGGEKFLNKIYTVISPIIPDSLEKYVKNLGTKENKPLAVYTEIKVYEESKKDVGVGSAASEEKLATAVSSISTESDILKKIKETKVKFVIPAKGVVSSRFGDREKIFEGIDAYHTGTDIAADKGTKVVSSTSGTVTAATYNKYNGNYVEVTNGKIVTKYCHLEKRMVKTGEKVKTGTQIGFMGSTGLSTGPHLHFEIVFDGVRIDPQKVLNF